MAAPALPGRLPLRPQMRSADKRVGRALDPVRRASKGVCLTVAQQAEADGGGNWSGADAHAAAARVRHSGLCRDDALLKLLRYAARARVVALAYGCCSSS